MANEYLGERPTKAVLGDVCPHCGHIYVEGEELHQHGRRRAVAALAAFLAAVTLNGCVSAARYRRDVNELELARIYGLSDAAKIWDLGYAFCERDNAEAIKVEHDKEIADLYRRVQENLNGRKKDDGMGRTADDAKRETDRALGDRERDVLRRTGGGR